MNFSKKLMSVNSSIRSALTFLEKKSDPLSSDEDYQYVLNDLRLTSSFLTLLAAETDEKV